MPTLRIHFKPSEAETYIVEWKRSTDALYSAANKKLVTKTDDNWTYTDVTITDTTTDYHYRITSRCGNATGKIRVGVVPAACSAVTSFTGSYQPCICPSITNMGLS